MANTAQMVEFLKCLGDVPYTLKTYNETFDKTKNKFVPFALFTEQINLINLYENNRFVLVSKYRQAGITTVTAGYCAHRIVFGDPENPEKILILANKQDTALEFLAKIKNFIDQYPMWLGMGKGEDKDKGALHYGKESQKQISILNRNNKLVGEVKAVATSLDALRGYTPTLLILDEAAFIEGGADLWGACLASLGTGGKAIMISTPRGMDELYYKTYAESLNGINTFKIFEMSWYDDPRYNKDLFLVQYEGNLVDWMSNPELRELYPIQRNVLDLPKEEMMALLKQNWKPCSPWFEDMCRELNFDKRMIAQELECSFLGSGDNVVAENIIEKQNVENVCDPIEKQLEQKLWIWKHPEVGHKYIMGCLPPDEKVITNSGLKSIQNVQLSDQLINEQGNYVAIKNKQTYSVVNEDIYEIFASNTFRSTKFTKEHPILVSQNTRLNRNYKLNHETLRFNERYWDFKYQYVKAENVNVGDWIKIPNIYKKELEFNINDKWTFNTAVREDFQIQSPIDTEDFWWFIGLWLGDGWLGRYGEYVHSITICFNKNEEYYLNKCYKIITQIFNRTPSITDKDSSYELTFNSKELYQFILQNFGQYSTGKNISEWVKFLPKKYKLQLLKGYFDSDGAWIKLLKNKKLNSKISYVSVNLELLESIQDILFSLGLISSLNKLRSSSVRSINGKLCQDKETYQLSLINHDSLKLINMWDDSEDIKLQKFNINDFHTVNRRVISHCFLDKTEEYIHFRIKKIKKSLYTGNVYNFECDTNTFMCHHITTHNCDVSRGDSEDFSCFTIIDFDEMEQVVEYQTKLPPDIFADIAFKWAHKYTAFIVIDITGGMGVATSRKLQELTYPNELLYFDGIKDSDRWKYGIYDDKTAGINYNNKRAQIIQAFEEGVRTTFKIRSKRVIQEMKTFIYINGKADHMGGHHDDNIQALAMALFVAQNSFTNLKKNEKQVKAMLNAWTTSSVKKDDVTKPKLQTNQPGNGYMWLFSGLK